MGPLRYPLLNLALNAVVLMRLASLMTIRTFGRWRIQAINRSPTYKATVFDIEHLDYVLIRNNVVEVCQLPGWTTAATEMLLPFLFPLCQDTLE